MIDTEMAKHEAYSSAGLCSFGSSPGESLKQHESRVHAYTRSTISWAMDMIDGSELKEDQVSHFFERFVSFYVGLGLCDQNETQGSMVNMAARYSQ